MMTREELDQALELLYEPDFDDLGRNTTPVRYPLDVIGAAARKQLALMPDANGRYKSLTVEKVENVLLSQYDFEIRQAMLSVVQPLAIAVLDVLNAVAVLDALGETE